MRRVWVFCDGSTGAAENGQEVKRAPSIPRRAQMCGAAAVARDDEGQIVGWEWQALPLMTNNEAEYAGLLLGLRLADRLHAEESVFLLDSEIVVGQMSGRCAVNSRSLHRWYWQACEAARDLPQVRYRAIPREWNRLADGLACQVGIAWEWLRGEVAGERERGSGGVTGGLAPDP